MDNLQLFLIEKVKKHEILYHKKLMNTTPFHLRVEAWNDISQALNISADAAEKTWEYLKKCYVSARTSELDSTLPWQFEKQMEFLIPHIESENPKSEEKGPYVIPTEEVFSEEGHSSDGSNRRSSTDDMGDITLRIDDSDDDDDNDDIIELFPKKKMQIKPGLRREDAEKLGEVGVARIKEWVNQASTSKFVPESEDVSIIPVEDFPAMNEEGCSIINAEGLPFINDKGLSFNNEEGLSFKNEEGLSFNNEEVLSFNNEEVLSFNNEEVLSFNNEEVLSFNNEEGLSFSNKESLSFSNKESLSFNNKEGLSFSNKECLSFSNKECLSFSNKEGLSFSNKEGLSFSNKECLSFSNKEGLSFTNKEGLSFSNKEGLSFSNEEGLSFINEEDLSFINEEGFSTINEEGFSTINEEGFSTINEERLSIIKEENLSIKEEGLSTIKEEEEEEVSVIHEDVGISFRRIGASLKKKEREVEEMRRHYEAELRAKLRRSQCSSKTARNMKRGWRERYSELHSLGRKQKMAIQKRRIEERMKHLKKQFKVVERQRRQLERLSMSDWDNRSVSSSVFDRQLFGDDNDSSIGEGTTSSVSSYETAEWELASIPESSVADSDSVVGNRDRVSRRRHYRPMLRKHMTAIGHFDEQDIFYLSMARMCSKLLPAEQAVVKYKLTNFILDLQEEAKNEEDAAAAATTGAVATSATAALAK